MMSLPSADLVLYCEAFLTTYRTFISPEELIKKLQYRYPSCLCDHLYFLYIVSEAVIEVTDLHGTTSPQTLSPCLAGPLKTQDSTFTFAVGPQFPPLPAMSWR